MLAGTQLSNLVILDAKDLEKGPVAVLEIRQASGRGTACWWRQPQPWALPCSYRARFECLHVLRFRQAACEFAPRPATLGSSQAGRHAFPSATPCAAAAQRAARLLEQHLLRAVMHRIRTPQWSQLFVHCMPLPVDERAAGKTYHWQQLTAGQPTSQQPTFLWHCHQRPMWHCGASRFLTVIHAHFIE